MFMARAVCSCLVLHLHSAELSPPVTNSFEWSWTISVNGNEGTQDPENWTQYLSIVSELFTVYTQQPPVHLTWGLLRVCAGCPTPRLNLKFELRPSWNNIHDTFPTGTAHDTTPLRNILIIFFYVGHQNHKELVFLFKKELGNLYPFIIFILGSFSEIHLCLVASSSFKYGTQNVFLSDSLYIRSTLWAALFFWRQCAYLSIFFPF
jgi:hypothetical protein